MKIERERETEREREREGGRRMLLPVVVSRRVIKVALCM